MYGPELLVASLSVPRTGAGKSSFKYGNEWQYHPRSDYHDRLACWGLMLDLMVNCPLLRSHVASGTVGYGLHAKFTNFETKKTKKIDLVICRPRADAKLLRGRTFAEYADDNRFVLSDEVRAELARLPTLHEVPVGSVRIAVEAKACMTEHIKARPRYYDELNSTHQTIHGHSEHALSVGLALVNLADSFISPDRNKFDISKQPPEVTQHKQPHATVRVLESLEDLPRRNREGEVGFDAFSVTVVRCRNDGSPVELVNDPPAPQHGENFRYEQMVTRVTQLYERRFPGSD